MRSRKFDGRTIASLLGVFVTGLIVACATAAPSGEVVSLSDPPSDAGVLPVDDAEPAAPYDAGIADAAMPCSPDGWCPMTLPGTNINLYDVAPFKKRTLGLFVGTYIGIKVGEFTAEDGWILQRSPFEWPYYMQTSGPMWAPDENTVYFTVVDFINYGATVVRAHRPNPPETEWTWQTGRIPCEQYGVTAPIGGSGEGDLHVALCGKIYRLDESSILPVDASTAADAGADTLRFVDEGSVDVDSTYPLIPYDIAGTGPDDLWLVGGRLGESSCVVVVHKTASGFQTVVEGVPSAAGCSARDESPVVSGLPNPGIYAPSKNRLIFSTRPVGANEQSVLVNLGLSGEQVTIDTTRPSDSSAVLGAVWGTSQDDLLFVDADRAIIHGQSLWGDSPLFEFSRLSINGSPNSTIIYRIRGTSENLWAVGVGNAYHKSTP